MTEDTRSKLSLMDLVDPPVKPYTVPIPKDGSVYSYMFIKEGLGRWEKWSESLKDVGPIPKDALFNEVIVQTVDTVRQVLQPHFISECALLLFVMGCK